MFQKGVISHFLDNALNGWFIPCLNSVRLTSLGLLSGRKVPATAAIAGATVFATVRPRFPPALAEHALFRGSPKARNLPSCFTINEPDCTQMNTISQAATVVFPPRDFLHPNEYSAETTLARHRYIRQLRASGKSRAARHSITRKGLG